MTIISEGCGGGGCGAPIPPPYPYPPNKFNNDNNSNNNNKDNDKDSSKDNNNNPRVPKMQPFRRKVGQKCYPLSQKSVEGGRKCDPLGEKSAENAYPSAEKSKGASAEAPDPSIPVIATVYRNTTRTLGSSLYRE